MPAQNEIRVDVESDVTRPFPTSDYVVALIISPDAGTHPASVSLCPHPKDLHDAGMFTLHIHRHPLTDRQVDEIVAAVEGFQGLGPIRRSKWGWQHEISPGGGFGWEDDEERDDQLDYLCDLLHDIAMTPDP